MNKGVVVIIIALLVVAFVVFAMRDGTNLSPKKDSNFKVGASKPSTSSQGILGSSTQPGTTLSFVNFYALTSGSSVGSNYDNLRNQLAKR